MSSSSEKPEIYRPAGLFERYHITRQFLKLDSCVIVAGKFVSARSPQERLSPETLYPAVAHALRVHAALSVRIEGEHKSGPEGPSFARMPEVNVAGAVRFLEAEGEGGGGEGAEGDLASVMEAEFMDPIDASKGLPLWRIVVTVDNVVLFAWHHAIGDGQSGLAVLRTLLSGLNRSSGESDEDKDKDKDSAFIRVHTRPDAQLVPPIEQLTDLSVSFRTLLSLVLGLVLPQGWLTRDVWTGHAVVTSTCDVVATRVRIIALPPPSAARLLALSKSHGATLTATLYVLAVCALSKLVSAADPGAQQWKRLATLVPTSLRPLAHLSPSVMCEAVSTYQRSEPILLSGFSWARAAAYTRELHAAVPKTRETIGSLKYLSGKYENFFRGKLGKKRAGSFEISNVGVFKANVEAESAVPEDARWNIESVYFAQDDGVGGAALKINVAGSPNGGVNVCLTWGAGAVDDVLAETFVNDLQSSIEKLVEDA